MRSNRNPLELPEVVVIVLEYLAGTGDASTIAQCAEVNRLWAYEATRVLWRSASFSYFSRVSPVRRQWYAGRVRQLSVPPSADPQILDNALHWPLLRRLDVWGWSYSENQLYQFLGPQLRTLRLEDGLASDNMLSRLPALCPNLSTLSLQHLHHVTANTLLQLLQDSPSITTITLAEIPWALHQPLLSHLANRPGLKELDIRDVGRSGNNNTPLMALPDILGQCSSPFADLVDANFFTEPSVFTQLLQHLSSRLEILSVTFLSPFFDTLSLFNGAQCRNLTYLDVIFDHHTPSYVDGRSLVNIAEQCRSLQYIRLACDIHDIVINNLTDVDIERITSLLHQLTFFELHMGRGTNTDISIQSLRSFGRCRNLTDFDINQEFALEDLAQEGPCLFPKLKELGMAATSLYHQRGRSDIMRAIGPVKEYHFPSLQKIHTESGDFNFNDVEHDEEEVEQQRRQDPVSLQLAENMQQLAAQLEQ